MKKDFLTIADWSGKELLQILDLSKKMKANPKKYAKSLEGKSVALIFEKHSLRTHVTFEIGIKQLGAHTVYLTNADINLGKRESMYDVAKNLERWVDAVVVRTFAQKNVDDLAQFAKASIVNALTDFEILVRQLEIFSRYKSTWALSKERNSRGSATATTYAIRLCY